jgi:hypothetical protein
MSDSFTPRVMATNMEVALQRACIALSNGETYAARRFIAARILARAESEEKNLAD